MANKLSIDLTKLDDTVYMETLTGTPAWADLERYMRGSFLVEFLGQLRNSDLPEEVRHQVTAVFLRNLDDDERSDMKATIEVSGLLDTLIDMRRN